MMEMKMYFSKLPDKRDNRGLKHELANIIVMRENMQTLNTQGAMYKLPIQFYY